MSPNSTATARAIKRAEVRRWYAIALIMSSMGGVAVELALATPAISASPDWVAHVAAAGFVALGLWAAIYSEGAATAAETSTYRPRLFAGTIVAVTTILISLLIAVAHGVTILPMFYIWPQLSAAYVFSRRAFAISVGLCVVAYGTALIFASQGEAYPWADLLLTCVAMSATLMVVRVLSETTGTLLKELKRMASFDPLTKVLNRRSFDRRAQAAWDAALEQDEQLAAIVLDLDRFKQLNDLFGHAAGDRALQHVAKVLRETVRPSDLLARTGGEEFAIVLPNTNLATAVELAEGFRATLAASWAPDEHPLTASIGVAMRTQADGIERLLGLADHATYAAKTRGRDQVAISSPESDLQLLEAASVSDAPTAAV